MPPIRRESVQQFGQTFGGLAQVLIEMIRQNREMAEINRLRQQFTSPIPGPSATIPDLGTGGPPMQLQGVSLPGQTQFNRPGFLEALLPLMARSQQAQKTFQDESMALPKQMALGPDQTIFDVSPFSGEMTPRGRTAPRPMQPNLPEGFAQIQSAEEKARLFNQTYGANLPASAFEKTSEPSDMQVFRAEDALRKQFTSDKRVANFIDIQQKFDTMRQAYAESLASGNRVAADQALITLFNKITDPESVVRESEYARTPSDLSLLNRIRGKIQSLAGGGPGLTDEDRKAIVAMAKKFADVSAKKYRVARTDYEGTAKRRKFDIESVIGTDIGGVGNVDFQFGGSPGNFQEFIVNGKKYRIPNSEVGEFKREMGIK